MESTELARLRWVAGKQTTRLTHYGRKTGEPHEVTIWFVLDTDKLYIGTANINRQWYATFRRRQKSGCPWAARRSTAMLVSSLHRLGRVLSTVGVMRDNTGSFEVTLAG